MDSGLIYKVTHNIANIEWLNTTFENGAWIYFGHGEEANKQFVVDNINEYFADETILYVSWTRTGSKEILKENVEFELADVLGLEDFSIWNSNFKRVIDFKGIGVMRFGVNKSTG